MTTKNYEYSTPDQIWQDRIEIKDRLLEAKTKECLALQKELSFKERRIQELEEKLMLMGVEI